MANNMEGNKRTTGSTKGDVKSTLNTPAMQPDMGQYLGSLLSNAHAIAMTNQENQA